MVYIYREIVAILCTMLAILLIGCGTAEPPSFTEKPRESFFLNVDDNEISSDEAATSTGESDQAADELNDAIATREDLADDTFSEVLENMDDDAKDSEDIDTSSADAIASQSDDDINGSTGTEEEDDDTKEFSNDGTLTSELSQSEQKACAALQGVSAEHIVVAGNQKRVNLSSKSVFALRVAGNQSEVDLNLTGSAERMAGLCIFATGNQASVRVIINGLVIDRFIYIARGNKSNGSLAITNDGDIRELAVNLSGNGAQLDVSGYGAGCNSALVRTKHNSNYTCQ